MSSTNPLPETGFLRVQQIIGDPTANPPIPPIVPVARSTWFKWCKNGTAPAQVKIGPRASAWRVSDIRDFIASIPGSLSRLCLPYQSVPKHYFGYRQP